MEESNSIYRGEGLILRRNYQTSKRQAGKEGGNEISKGWPALTQCCAKQGIYVTGMEVIDHSPGIPVVNQRFVNPIMTIPHGDGTEV